VHISFHHNPTPDPYDEDLRILIEYHIYISNDRKHDLNLCNIALNSINNIWQNKDIHLNGIRYGVTIVHPNLRATSPNTFFLTSKFDYELQNDLKFLW